MNKYLYLYPKMNKHTMLIDIFNMLFYYYPQYLVLKAGQLRQVHRAVGTLTWEVNQPYHVCCLT